MIRVEVPAEPVHHEPDGPEGRRGPTDLLDLGDAKLRLRARAVTQLAKNDREKALAIYGFVKRIPFAKPFKLKLRGPRQVIGRSLATSTQFSPRSSERYSPPPGFASTSA